MHECITTNVSVAIAVGTIGSIINLKRIEMILTMFIPRMELTYSLKWCLNIFTKAIKKRKNIFFFTILTLNGYPRYIQDSDVNTVSSSICLQRPKPPTTPDTKSCGETTWSFGGAWVRRKDSAEVHSKGCFQGITATPEKHRLHVDLPHSNQYEIASLWSLSQLGPTLFLGRGLQRRGGY